MESANISDVSFSEALESRYYAYAMSTIMSRSLPDVRDGLKPVHRRLLYAMRELKLNSNSGFKKCARVVGDVIGKYHPHGDTAVYDTLVRLAQSFSVRYPLVDGQGNFGSVDGDNAAAMRYTEARLTEVALALMEDIAHGTVDFRPTYDGSEHEPVVFPAAFPNLLANGSEGIAVGMATSIPPHNASELCDALLYLIKTPGASTSKLVDFIPAPDFPTGGVIIDNQDTIIKAYETGKGAFRVRAKWEKEELSHGLYQIIITEIPYQVQKSKLIEKIAELYKAKKLALLGNIRDESTEHIRIVLEPKSRSVNPEMLMESLFKLTDLENRFNLNMNVITSDGVPKVLPLKDVLQEFLNHRHDVLIRKSKFRLEQIDRRLEILAGLLIAYLNIDEVIHIIREEDHPKTIMMEKWDLTELQVDAILNMRLRQLRKLEEIEIKKEHDELSSEKDALLALLDSEDIRWKHIADAIKAIKKQFGKNTELGKRYTTLEEAEEAEVISIEAFVEKEPITVLLSEKGWIRALKGHIDDVSDMKYKDEDCGKFHLKTYTTSKLLLFASNGSCFTLNGNDIHTGKGYGEPVQISIDLEAGAEIIELFEYHSEAEYMMAADNGKGFIIAANDIVANTRSGKKVLNLVKDSTALLCRRVTGSHVVIVGNNRKLLIIPSDDIPRMKRGQGVRLQFYQRNVKMSDIKFINIEEGLSWKLGDRTRSETDLTAWIGNRGNSGRMVPTGFPKNNKFE
ncbi:MAG: DNA topoisomerase IV subunit A [Rickettsiales bacterium]|nr:DNA topoisomerase IV subunit A [Rickettsiales bacterium]